MGGDLQPPSMFNLRPPRCHSPVTRQQSQCSPEQCHLQNQETSMATDQPTNLQTLSRKRPQQALK